MRIIAETVHTKKQGYRFNILIRCVNGSAQLIGAMLDERRVARFWQ